MPPKSVFRSKTLALQTVTVLAAFYPPVTALVAAHPSETLLLLGMANAALRWVTRGRVTLFI